MPESERANQGKFQPIVPPFIAPLEGNSTAQDDVGIDNNYPPHFGEVQATATGPSGLDSAFASFYGLDMGNTALPGGTFFVETRGLASVSSGVVPFGVTGASNNQSGRPDGSVITDWLFFARGFSFGGFTGTTSGAPIVSQPTSYTDEAGNVLSDLWVHPMDLPTVPEGSYDDMPGGYEPTPRTNNKVLHITGTGSTFSANFKAAFTDMEFSINHIPTIDPDHSGTSLIVQSLSTTNAGPIDFDFPANNAISSQIDDSGAQDVNRARVDSLGNDFYDRNDQVFINGSSDLMFLFNYGNMNSPTSVEQYHPVGNVLRCHFPVPVRGVSIISLDQNGNLLNSSNPTRSNYRGSRIFVEGDFADGSTFTYIMFPRGGANPTSSSNNNCGFMSYLALNSREDKHIKNLYISNVWWDPISNGTGQPSVAGGHLPHGPVDFLGPGRFYCGDLGITSDFVITNGNPNNSLGSTGPAYPLQDDIAIKINVMPKYNRNFFQCEKRPDGEDGSYGTNAGNMFNFASYNEWRKITKDQIGKTFGRTGPIANPLDGGNNPVLGTGIVFPSAVTGDSFGVTMSFLPKGDIPTGTGSGIIGVTASVLHEGEKVEAFQYEVIKGATVDGTFIPVWKKTRTL